ncbi:MAG: hypothetical protein ACIAQZ_01650 [Sedimentisphaeraceae bacterium JB056]
MYIHPEDLKTIYIYGYWDLPYNESDLTKDGNVNLEDLMMLAANWLM